MADNEVWTKEDIQKLLEAFDMIKDVNAHYAAQDEVQNVEPYTPSVKVVLTCTREYCDEQDVEFLDIAEDISGRDILTFRCPRCHETHTSFRLG
jgi:hypothetical protein